ncbi:MAG: hypothetical protein VYC11_01755 [Candidatus Thermoplasmatota archaeon]|nr:hypothetical protein [Candidatus Thermoplasmatota archaeon]MEC9090072.1 hypothetical protein [Candidatus Thermoplasmatota archaeon]MED5487258.1 hypothetical protein [Candidatus Thermoplasmatota archaeon]
MDEDYDEELVVSVSDNGNSSRESGSRIQNILGATRIIWTELTAGVGAWGSLKPIVAGLLAVVPFFFLGQHFNRQHRKGFDWALLQLPLVLTLVLWPVLWAWSIVDAYRVAMLSVSEAENRKRALQVIN